MILPCDQKQFQYLIDRELLIVRNIPKSLSSDTIYKYLSHYGVILDFQILKESGSRNQALVLMKNIKDAIDMQNSKVSSIGGFYLERVTMEKHSFLLDQSILKSSISVSPVRKVNNKSPSPPPIARAAEPATKCRSSAAASPEHAAFDDGERKDGDDDLFDIDFQSTKELGKQLIQGYAQVIASSYIAVSNVVDQTGVRAMLLFLISLFRVMFIYKTLFQYFRVESRVKHLIELGKESKKTIASTPAGKPIIDQLDLVIDAANDLVGSTQRIILSKQRRLKGPDDQ